MRVIKTILFHILSAYRGIFLFIFGGISTFFTASVFAAMILGFPFVASIISFILGIMFSAFCWYYDILLLKLQPNNVELFLIQ